MESAPNSSFDSEPNEPNRPSNGKESSKKFTPWSPAVSPVRRIEHAGGASLPEAEKRLPFRPLGERNAGTTPDSDAAHPERETPAHPAVEDLGVAATKEEREQLDAFLHAREQEISEGHRADTEKSDTKEPKDKSKNSESGMITPPNGKKSETVREKPAERGAFDEFIENHKELADLSKEALAEMSIDAPDSAQDSGPDVAFEEFTHHEESNVPIDSVAEAAKEQIAFQPPAGHPESASDPVELAAFKGFLQDHGELANLSAEAIHEAPVVAESSTESPLSDDDTFRKLISDEGFPDPGSNTWQEGEPGTPPTAEGGDSPPVPPIPPTAEGGAYDAPEPGGSGGFGEQNLPNPNLAQNPWATAGDLLDPATIAGISAIEAHQELNILRNTAKIKGLEAAVGILGLGLILEHFGAKRRHKRNKQQIKAQGKELAQTNKTLREEKFSHLQTRQELRRLKRAHTTTSERLREVQRHDLPRVETVAGVGVVGAAAATEIANRVAAQKTEVQRQQRQEEVTIANLTLAETMTAEGRPVTLDQQEEVQQAIRRRVAPELAEAAAAAVYANTIKQEMRHERLQDKSADAGMTKGTTIRTHRSDQSGMPILPPPSTNAGTVTSQTQTLSAAERAKQSRYSSQLASRWTWAIIGLIVVAVAAALFG